MGTLLSFDIETKTASLDPLLRLVQSDMQKVNALIIERTHSGVDLIPEIAKHLIDSGGKRLRPMLTLASTNAFSYHNVHHIKLAASVEFMHTATLLHDDVVDESDVRRGKKSARLLWGNQNSVLVGDFLLGQAFKMMVEVGSLEALDVLSTASAVIAEGEVMQLGTARNLATTEDDYIHVVKAKTAALFAAACEVGPILSQQNDDMRAALRSYGMNLGIAFQLVDDILDYAGDSKNLGKSVGDDFREGKMTLPVVLAYRKGLEDERNFWQKSFQEEMTDHKDFDHALKLLEHHNTLHDTVLRARHYGDLAKDALVPLPSSPYKQALLELVDYCLKRVS